jgi:FkbH-like protein
MLYQPNHDLCWLPSPPEDFASQCRAIVADRDHIGTRLQHLACHALSSTQLVRLAKSINEARASQASLAPLTPFRLGVVGNGTLDTIVPALVASAARHGIALDCTVAEYDQFLQEAISPDSPINRVRPDAVLVALDYRGLNLQCTLGDPAAEEAGIDDALGILTTIRQALHRHGGAISIVQTVAPPPEGLFGSFDRLLPGTARHMVDGLNRAIVDSMSGTADVLLDIAGLAETVGLAQWHSPAQWNMAKLPFADDFVPLYADHVVRLIAALRGKSRRCLVLDLDNTLWGGVIGDDGLDGIKLAQGDPTGEAFLTVQKLALALRERGIALAISSKNNDDVARAPFRSHPEMLLREDHLAVFQANWDDKATNLTAIADALSLGLESLVLLDDNPAERALVRRLAPQVAVPELPDDPALFARTLAAAGYFEAVAFSEEDRRRAAFYQGNAERVALAQRVGSLDDFLASLDMTIEFHPFDSVGRQRIAQLINKSNQFNLTTRRYTEAEVEAAQRDPACFTLQVRLTDRFGDNGMISVIICRERGDTAWEIDTWLMSCRVLGRGVEAAVLTELSHHARERGIRSLIGIYRPTNRNAMVREHYPKLGFALHGEGQDGTTEWQISTEADVPSVRMAVRRAGFELAVA